MKRMILTVLAVFLSTSCQVNQQQVLRIGTNLWPGYEPLYLAQHQDRFDKNIKLIEYPSASEVMRAFRNRSLEAASLTLDEALSLVEANIPIKIVLVHDISYGGDVIIANKNIGSVQQLRGKRIGVESGAMGAYLLSRALELNGMSFKDIKVVNLDVNMHEDAIKLNNVDAVVTFEPIRINLLNAGYHEIFSTRQIPNEIIDVMVVHSDVLESEKQSVVNLINAWFDSVTYMKAHPVEYSEFISTRLKISPQELMASYKGLVLLNREQNLEFLSGKQPKIYSTIRTVKRILMKNGLLMHGVDASNIVDTGAL